jgi:hypothetical protein
MASNSHLRTLVQNPKRRETIVSILYLGILLLFARYLLSPWFGFYEDDYTLVVRGMASSWGETWTFIRDLFLTFGGQGRPLQHSLLFLISRIVGQLGGLHLGYYVAFAIVLLNCSLFYLLVRKLAGHGFALLAATFYTLYSADTTQAFLYHAFGLQQSLTFFLLAGLAYTSGKRILPYLLILGSLLSYENTYFVFLVFPLLCLKWNKNLPRKMALHSMILIFIFLIILALRLATGESRATGLSWPAILTTPLLHMIQGPIIAVGSNFLRPLQALQSLDPAVYALTGLAFVLFFWVLVRELRHLFYDQEIREEAKNAGGRADIGIGKLKQIMPAERAPYLRILLVGMLMLVLAYPLTFTVRAYALSGRDTRVHFAAIIGSSLFWASAWWLLLSRLRTLTWRKVGAGLLSLNLALLLGFGLVVQKDYAEAWTLQRELWRTILVNVPDIEEGITIFIDPAGLEDTQYIDANTWALPRVLPYIFEFTDTWEKPPAAYRLLPDWQNRLLFNDQEIKAVDYTWSYITSPWTNTVILNTQDNRIASRLHMIEIEGIDFTLKDDGAARGRFSCGYLFKTLIPLDDKQSPSCR